MWIALMILAAGIPGAEKDGEITFVAMSSDSKVSVKVVCAKWRSDMDAFLCETTSALLRLNKKGLCYFAASTYKSLSKPGGDHAWEFENQSLDGHTIKSRVWFVDGEWLYRRTDSKHGRVTRTFVPPGNNQMTSVDCRYAAVGSF